MKEQDAHPSSHTSPAQGETQQAVPRMPHERDESTDSQALAEPSAQRMGQLAHDDAQRGLPDTSRGAEFDATYHGLHEGTAPAQMDAGSDAPRPGQKKLRP